MKGFEPSTSRSRTVRSSRAELHPEVVRIKDYVDIPLVARVQTAGGARLCGSLVQDRWKIEILNK